MTGRSTKLTDSTWARIKGSVEDGNYARTAALAAGIGETTFYRWRQQGAQDRREGRRTRLAHFDEDLEAAQARAEEYHLEQITQAAQGNDAKPSDWKAAAWLLERKYPDRFARRTAREISGPGGGPVQMDAGQGLSGLLAAARAMDEG